MKKYEMRQIGLKLKEIKPDMKKLLEQYGDTPKFIKEIRDLLINCIVEDSLPKAIAIIRWVAGNTFYLTGDDLVLIDNKIEPSLYNDEAVPAISTLAYAMDNRDFCFDLMGYCEMFSLVEKDSIYHTINNNS